jgi:hypothetical protein
MQAATTAQANATLTAILKDANRLKEISSDHNEKSIQLSGWPVASISNSSSSNNCIKNT